jgi:alcohol dehydrogenase class IV
MKFQYFMPTRVVTGEDCLKNSGTDLKALGQKAFIMTGASSAEKNGSLAHACEALKEAGMEWVHYKGVQPNPTLEQVREASEMAREEGTDIILAIGGGSAIDAAKAVAVLTVNSLSDEELLSQRNFPKVLPLIAVPTTAGTGSEVTQYSILTNNKLQTKSFLVSPQLFPRIAYLDGRYMEHLPYTISAATAVDAASHAIEGYLAVRSTPVAQLFALDSLSRLAGPFRKMEKGETLTPEDREKMLFASMEAGIVIAQSGTTAVHVMGYSLTYFKGIDHGKANGLLMGAYFEFLYGERKNDIDKLLAALQLDSISSLSRLMTTLIGREKLSQTEIEKFTSLAMKAANIANTNPQPTREDINKMLTASLA